MKTTIGRTRRTQSKATSRARRPLAALTVVASLPAVVSLAPTPAMAACVQAGNVVTCSGATSTGFGTGAETNLAVTVQSGASITVPSAGIAIYLSLIHI